MSNILQVEKKNARTAYKGADAKGKQLLEDLYGKAVFAENLKDRIKTFEDICAEAGVQPCEFEFISNATRRQIGANAFEKLQLIYEVVNNDANWKADYTNDNQYKYYPYFRYSAGSGFSLGGVGFGGTTAGVGARLSTYSREMAEWIATTFKDIYNDFLNS